MAVDERKIAARRTVAEMRCRLDDKVGDIVRVFGEVGFHGPIRGDAVALQIAAADQRKTLAVLIDSEGGAIADMRRITDAIMSRRGPTRTVAVSYAASAAAVIFAAGSQRWATAYSRFCLHNSEKPGFANRRRTAAELRRAAEDLEKTDHWMVAFLHQQTRQPSALLRVMLAEDKVVSAEQARLMGLVTHIIPAPRPAPASRTTSRPAPRPTPRPAPARAAAPSLSALDVAAAPFLVNRPLGITAAGLDRLISQHRTRLVVGRR